MVLEASLCCALSSAASCAALGIAVAATESIDAIASSQHCQSGCCYPLFVRVVRPLVMTGWALYAVIARLVYAVALSAPTHSRHVGHWDDVVDAVGARDCR